MFSTFSKLQGSKLKHMTAHEAIMNTKHQCGTLKDFKSQELPNIKRQVINMNVWHLTKALKDVKSK
jgi:hypothetical protein